MGPFVSWVVICWAATSSPAAAEPGRPWAVGNDATLWVIDERPALGGAAELTIYFGDRREPRVFTSPTLPMRHGDLSFASADKDGLVLLYSDGSVERLTFDSRAGGPRWRGATPLAFAADVAGTDLYLVSDAVASTRPAGEGSSGDAAAGSIVGLWRARPRAWERLSDLPEAARSATRFSAAARDGVVYLGWRSETGEWQAAEWKGQDWSDAETIVGSALFERIDLAVSERGPMAAAVGATEAGRGLVRVVRRDRGVWRLDSWPGDGATSIEVAPAQATATWARGRLAVVRRADGAIEVGEATSEGGDGFRWRPAERTSVMALSPRPPWAGWLEAGGALTILILILVSRQEALRVPVALPAATALAPPWMRGAALLIDLIPAAAVMAPLWGPRLADLMIIVPRLSSAAIEQGWAARLAFEPLLAVLGVLAVYCWMFERLAGATPGKRLLGLRVIGEDGLPAGAMQSLVRNLLRVPELGLTLIGFTTLFLMLVVSRNHQRIGDVMAGTIVVRRAPPTARPAILEPQEDVASS